MRQTWDCSQIKEEEKIAKRKMKGKSLQVDGVKRVPELVVSQIMTKEKELRKTEGKGNVAGWSKKRSKRRTITVKW